MNPCLSLPSESITYFWSSSLTSREHSRRETRSGDKVKKANAELRDSLSNIKDTQGDLTAKVRLHPPWLDLSRRPLLMFVVGNMRKS
jgi:hypothetical protein